MKFDRFSGIDYSGVETPESRIKDLHYLAAPNGEHRRVRPTLPEHRIAALEGRIPGIT